MFNGDFIKVLEKLPLIVKGLLVVILLLIVLTVVLSSRYSVEYISNSVANISKTITQTFKQHGMDTAVVESTINLGLISFKVIGKDETSQ